MVIQDGWPKYRTPTNPCDFLHGANLGRQARASAVYICVHRHDTWGMLTCVQPLTAQAQTWLKANAIKVGVSGPEDSMDPEEP